MTVSIRQAHPGDEIGVARIHVRSWQAGYRGLLPDSYLNGLRPEDRAARYTFAKPWPDGPRTLVVLSDTVIRGFATIAAPESADGPAELNALYVDPDAWGLGMGRALEAAAGAELTQLGYSRAGLWVLAGNARAQGFYAARGWRDTGMAREASVWSVTVAELRWMRDL